MPILNTDSPLWYNVGVFGEAGYAVPNWSNDPFTLNPQIADLVQVVGRNLFAMMHCEDTDLRVPPSINTLRRLHRLYVRFWQILNGRAIPYNVANMETVHASPSGQPFLVFPIPLFKVRNKYMKRWAEMILMSLTDAMQHTENRKSIEISTAFAGQVGQYMTRVYQNMAVEMFGKTAEEVRDPKFVLTEEDLATYDPSKYFTQTELVDTVSRFDFVFTEDRLELLAEGIPVTDLPDLKPWPMNIADYAAATRTDASARNHNTDSGNTGSGSSNITVIAPPGP